MSLPFLLVRSDPSGSQERPARAGGRLRLRATTLSDLPLLVAHRRRMWEAIGGRTRHELDRADTAYRRWVRSESAGGRFFGYVVEEKGGRVAGSGAIWLAPQLPRPGRLSGRRLPYIHSMYTDPAFRARGVASRLVRTMVCWARARGYARIYLHASPMGRSVYARLGFVAGNEMRLELDASPTRARTRRSARPRRPPSRSRAPRTLPGGTSAGPRGRGRSRGP